MAASTIRFGAGCTREVGLDFRNLNSGRGVSKVLLITDPTVATLPVMTTVLDALDSAGVKYDIYKEVKVEPKDYSVMHAVEYGKTKAADAEAYLAVGGGSVMDTAKIVNLLNVYPEKSLLDFVNRPLGKGEPIEKTLKPLICVPTTAGTGSETTGTAIFDLTIHKAKTGISHRALKPSLGIIDPVNTYTLPAPITASSGLDVLCHSLESLTAIPFNSRFLHSTSTTISSDGTPTANPLHRPAYQGANPISDIFSLASLKLCTDFLPRATHDPCDVEAREKMALAAALAGVGFGNAGVHLCHGMSYPISGLNPGGYIHPSYPVGTSLIPHGVSVAVTAPAVFKFTAPSNPSRHLQAAEAFGVDVSQVKLESVGDLLSDAIKQFLEKLGGQPRGLRGLGIKSGDIGGLVEGTVPQRRVVVLAPGLSGGGRAEVEVRRGSQVGDRVREELKALFEEAMEW